MKIYLVILHDRHSDDAIAAFQSLESAEKDVAETKKQYPGYRWRSVKTEWVQCWEVIGNDDGPWIHVEECEVKP